jgi:DNA polymerase I-like protein with 3'-5' exonuclease and polymerase domains
MNYIITNNRDFFESIGQYNYCRLEDMVLPKTIAVDTETTSLYPRKGHMFSVQIGTGTDNYLIDLQQLGGELVFEQVKPYLVNKRMVLHNSCFDIGWFYKYNFFGNYEVYDTMIASMLLNNGIKGSRNDFGTVMLAHLGVNYDKSEQKTIAKIQLSNKQAIQYAFNDVDRLVELMKVLAKKMQDYGVMPAFKLHCRYVKVLAYMEQCGLPINVEKWKAKISEDKIEFANCEKAVVKFIYENLPEFRDNQIDMFDTSYRVNLNLNSSQQMIPVFQKFGINTTSDEDADKDTITESVISRSSHPFVPIWLNYTGAQKVLSTYGENVLEKVEDGKIYSTYNPMLDTARISTRRGEFPSLVIPSNQRTRECFEAPDEHMIIICDFSNQEGVTGADLHHDPVTLASVNEGKDLHCALARVIFEEISNLSDEEIMKNHKDKRQFSKAPRFAKAYGGNGFTIAKNLNVPLKEGERISDAYDFLHAPIIEWGNKVLKQAIEVGYIESADGFKLKLPFFNEFKELHEWVEEKDKSFWTTYRKGKLLYRAKGLQKELDEIAKQLGESSKEYFNFKEEHFKELYLEEDEFAFSTYVENKGSVGEYFRRKSKYLRLCLNNPIQSTAAFQTKLSAVLLFEEIIRRGDQWKAEINNIIHDEIFICVNTELSEDYKIILQESMRKGSSYYLTSGLVQMGADAKIGKNWYEAK